MNSFYRKHYTIVEMLVVISILGVLIALGAPAAIRMISKKKTTVAKQEVLAIVQAIKSYEAEYQKLPFATSQNRDVVFFKAGDSEAFFQVLLGLNEDENPTNIKFLKWLDRFVLMILLKSMTAQLFEDFFHLLLY